jgi:hypothetical protein
MPHLGSGITWDWTDKDGVVHPVMASPNLKDGHIQVIDMKTWKTLKVIPTAGPGFFLRSHENTPYAWADVFFGKNRDVMHVIDKRTLEIVADLKPEPGKTGHPRRIRPLRKICPGVALGNGRRGDRLRRPDAEGDQTPAHEAPGRQVQRLEQDPAVGGDQSLSL